MKLHQLRYLAAVAQSGLNITAAAQKLHTSQPGVSKQIKLLEDELGFQIFVREGRNLTRITAAGQQVIERALQHPAGSAEHPRPVDGAARRGARQPLDRHHPHPGALRAAGRDPRVPQPLPAGPPQPAPGHLGADRGDGGRRPHRLRHRYRVRAAVRGPDAAAVLPLAPQRHRAARPSARGRRPAVAQGARGLPAHHLHVQLYRAVVTARGLRQGGADARTWRSPRATRT